jgi:fructoselysine 6-kinase
MAISTIAVSVGDNCIDHYLPPIERSFVGGNALNVAVTMNRAGLPTAYVGVIGDDDQGKLIQNTLLHEGVDVTHLKTIPGVTSYTEIRLTAEGDRQFIHEHVGPLQTLELDAETIHFICQHKLAHNTWLGGTQKYLPQFKQAGILVSMDYGERYTQDFFYDTIPNVNIAFFSLPEAEAYRAKELAKQAVRLGAQIAIITLGREGSLAYNGTDYTHPARQIQVVDTLGAGDTYIGVFLAQWLKSQPLAKCMEIATQAAALTCTHYGAWEYRTYESEIG